MSVVLSDFTTQSSQKVTGALASGALHVLILTLAAHDTVLPDSTELIAAVQPLIVTVLLVDKTVPAERVTEWQAPTLVSLDAIEIKPFALAELEPVAADSFERPRQAQNIEDIDAIASMQGVYVTQINARVARVLEMTGAGHRQEPAVRCVVHVIQDKRGVVLDVDMDECMRDDGERQRLASAIRAASPLPPPPDGLAMGSYLTLDVTSLY